MGYGYYYFLFVFDFIYNSCYVFIYYYVNQLCGLVELGKYWKEGSFWKIVLCQW